MVLRWGRWISGGRGVGWNGEWRRTEEGAGRRKQISGRGDRRMAGRDREPGGEQWLDGGVLAGATDRSVAGVRYGDTAAIAARVGARIGVWTGSSDADLSGGGSDGHAQGVRRSLRSGARPI